MARQDDFIEEALDAGFDQEQAEFLFERLAQRPHTHTADEVITDEEIGETLAEALDAIEADLD